MHKSEISRFKTPAIFVCVAITFAALLSVGCSSKPKVTPTQLDVSFEANTNINPDARGRASPVVVRYYQLKTLTSFNAAEADFFALYEHDQDILGADLISKEEFQFTPGEKKHFNRELSPDVCCIAVFAAFRDWGHARWHSTAQIRANKSNDFLIKLDGRSIVIGSSATELEKQEKAEQAKKTEKAE